MPKQLCFLKLDQSRLSQNQVQNLENMKQANKNYLESILCGAQTGFKRYLYKFLSIFFQKNINEILRSSKKSHFHDQSQFKRWFKCWLWECVQDTVELTKTAWPSQINYCKNDWLLKGPLLSKMTVICPKWPCFLWPLVSLKNDREPSPKWPLIGVN